MSSLFLIIKASHVDGQEVWGDCMGLQSTRAHNISEKQSRKCFKCVDCEDR